MQHNHRPLSKKKKFTELNLKFFKEFSIQEYFHLSNHIRKERHNLSFEQIKLVHVRKVSKHTYIVFLKKKSKQVN